MAKEKNQNKLLELEPLGGRVYAVGDIHGCLSELEVVINYFQNKALLTKEDLVVFIGDYVDRGIDSKGVVDLLIEFSSSTQSKVVFLKGNHEEMLLSYLGLGGIGDEVYITNGGDATFLSYGLSSEPNPEEALAKIPENHILFYQQLERYLISDKFVFAHAGLNPLRDLKFQLDEDLYWIRDEFIHNLHYFKKTIVFGHTPFEDVMFHLPYKIGIDTGLVYGNALTIVELKEELVIQIPSKTKDLEEFKFKMKGGLWPKFG